MDCPAFLNPLSAIKAGYMDYKNHSYTDWVKTLPCCCGCGRTATEAHHLVGHGFRGFASKSPDLFTIPLYRACHEDLHCGWKHWEDEYGDQREHVMATLLIAAKGGIWHLWKP